MWGPRGFNSIEEHDEGIIKRFNSVVSDEDDVYVLGDLMLGNNNHGIECINRLKGKLHIVFGNHCTDTRKALYKMLPNVVETADALRFKYNKYHFYCSHWPTLIDNFENCNRFWGLHGHTHSSNKFQFFQHCAYNVACEAHCCYPISIEQIIKDINSFGH